MKLDGLNIMNGKFDRHYRRLANVNRNEPIGEADSSHPVRMKAETKQPRQHTPQQSDDPRRGRMLDITT